MKVITLILAAVCAAPTLAAGQSSSFDSSTASKIRTLEYERAEALGRRDYVALDALFDNDLVFVEYDGILLSKAEYMAKIHKAGSTSLGLTVESMTVHTFETTAIVVGIDREKGVKDGQAYLQRRHFLNTWQYKSGIWICIAAAAMPLQR